MRFARLKIQFNNGNSVAGDEFETVGTRLGERNNPAIEGGQYAVMSDRQRKEVRIGDLAMAAEYGICGEGLRKRKIVGPEAVAREAGNPPQQSNGVSRQYGGGRERGFDEIRTKPVWVIGQVRKPAAAFRPNHAVTSA